jgi:hypothetical protein
MENVDLYTAIKEMREITERKGSFSISFMSLDNSKKLSKGIVHIDNARLRAQSSVNHNKLADIMLNLTNLDTNEYKHCYQPLIMEFNGKQVELK